jgi:TolB-like protein/DNA-binding winged helix-turn-helix (wHTH) protein
MDKSGISLIARMLRGEGSTGEPSLARGFRLGVWRVRPDLCTLESGGRRIQLEPKTMGVLLCLAQHAPATVTRERFIEEVWSGRVVSDEVLSRAISLLRSVLEDDASEPQFIRTVPRIGYALITPVEPLEPAKPRASGTMTGHRLMLGLGIVGLAAILGWLAWLNVRDGQPIAASDSAGSVRLAVLPLDFLGTAAQDRYISEGLTEELTVNLSRVNGLRVVARNSVQNFNSRDADLGEVARTLGATHVVTGSVRADQSRLRVSVHLSESGSGTELWADTYDRSLGDLFGVQAEIATAVTRALREHLPAISGGGAGLGDPPPDPDVYRLYLQGRQQLARRGEDGVRGAIGLLEQAVSADPSFLRAQLSLAFACSLLANLAPAEAGVALARADRALAVVARQTAMSDEVHAVRAVLELERNHWIEADEEFRAALRGNPDDTELRLLYSQLLGATGQHAAALNEAKQALTNDPLSPAAALRVAAVHLWGNDDHEAVRHLALARELGLTDSAAPELSMMLLLRQRNFDRLQQSMIGLQRRRGQPEDWVPPAVAAIRDPARGADAGIAIADAAATGTLDELVHLGALVLTRQDARAVELLLSRPRLRTGEAELLFSREATGLRGHPEFGKVVTKFRLDAYWDRFGWPPVCRRAGDFIHCS